MLPLLEVAMLLAINSSVPLRHWSYSSPECAGTIACPEMIMPRALSSGNFRITVTDQKTGVA